MKRLTMAVAGFALVACATHHIAKISKDDIPKELPKDINEKFEVKEIATLAPPQGGEKDSGALGTKEANLLNSPPTGPIDKPTKSKGKKSAKSESKTDSAATGDTGSGFKYPNRRPKEDPIWLGEKLTYEVTYFGMLAGEFTLEVEPYKLINNRKVYHVHGEARSSKVFSFFYKLEDVCETFFDYQGLFSHRFQLELDESKQTRAALELNDSEKGMTFYWNRWNHVNKGFTETKEYNPMPPFVQDSLSALYYVRTLPLAVGSMTNIPIASEGKVWEAEVNVLRKETISTPMGKLNTIVLKPETKFQGVLQKKGDSFIWLTDDDRRFMVQLEARVRIGTVFARLKSVERGTPP